MNKRRPLLYLLLGILFAILFYNYVVVPMIIQSSGGRGMGMGMHGGVYNSYIYFIDMRYALLMLIAIVGVIIFDILELSKASNKCSKCGYEIKDSRWGICPICGSTLKNKEGGIL